MIVITKYKFKMGKNKKQEDKIKWEKFRNIL